LGGLSLFYPVHLSDLQRLFHMKIKKQLEL